MSDTSVASASSDLRERDQIPERFKWDLTRIYPDWSAWQDAYRALDEKLGAFAALEERSGPALTPATVLGVKNPNDEIRATLDPETFERMFLEGRQAKLEDVLRSLTEES